MRRHRANVCAAMITACSDALGLARWIAGFIREAVKRHPRPWYRLPLVGFTSAQHPGFHELRKVVAPDHLLPEEILPGACSVIAFFIPFAPQLVLENASRTDVARSWAEAYVETNRSIQDIYGQLSHALRPKGVRAEGVRPTHNFDPIRLVSRWSHKHVAYLCGLGTFGVHHQLITPSGCAGRIGSMVLDAETESSEPLGQELCIEKAGGECGMCVAHCPTGALTSEGLDKEKCYAWLLEVDRRFSDLPSTDVCGKCSVQRCALMEHGKPVEASDTEQGP